MPAGRKPALAYCHKAVHMPATFGGTTTRLLQPLAKALRQWRQVLCSRQGFSWWSVGELFDGAADGVGTVADGVEVCLQWQLMP
jgi:hypothetical protein